MTDTMNAIAVKPGHLDELAALARNEHRMAKNACANALAHAMNAGDLLIEAKPKVAKGDWRHGWRNAQSQQVRRGFTNSWRAIGPRSKPRSKAAPS